MRERISLHFCPCHLRLAGELPYPSLAIALEKAIPVPLLGSTVELFLEMGDAGEQALSLFRCAVVQMRDTLLASLVP